MLTKARGNMYPWVTHCHTHLAGECPHRCSYCYVQRGAARLSGKYKGPLRLIEQEFKVNYGQGRTIFIEHLNDLFAEGVPDEWIERIVEHVWRFNRNWYVFQTKNPGRAIGFMRGLPAESSVGVTIETNRDTSAWSKAPSPTERAYGAHALLEWTSTFITIEPILDFDLAEFADLIRRCYPSFVNIGADSKGCGLPEPPADKVRDLIRELHRLGIEIRQKTNLERILGGAL